MVGMAASKRLAALESGCRVLLANKECWFRGDIMRLATGGMTPTCCRRIVSTVPSISAWLQRKGVLCRLR